MGMCHLDLRLQYLDNYQFEYLHLRTTVLDLMQCQNLWFQAYMELSFLEAIP